MSYFTIHFTLLTFLFFYLPTSFFSFFLSFLNSNHLTISHTLDDIIFNFISQSQVVEGIKEQYLETVLPGIGGLCTVLLGTYCGQSAVLIEKQPEDNMALVQLEDDLEIILISMRHIASRM